MGQQRSVSSLTGRVRKLVEERIARDKTNIKHIVARQLEEYYRNRVLEYRYLAPDTVQLILQKPITAKQRRYLGCGVVDPDNAGVDLWMTADIDILEPGEAAQYPHGAELLVMLKDENGRVYECGSSDFFDLKP
jgi:hypothetical protein